MTIALLTDFGTKDYFVGAMKGVILSINEAAQIIDITHEIPAQNIDAASFTLRACYLDFPKQTIFVAVVDPGVGSNRRAILVETTDYFFIAPDNGLLSFVFEENRSPRVSKGETLDSVLAHARASVYEITNKNFFAAREISRTFHGRDVFAPAAAHLSNGIAPFEFGAEIEDFVQTKIEKPRKTSENRTEAAIIHADRFGNLITNLRAEDLPEKFTIEINGKTIDKLQSFFAEARRGELFMIMGSAGFLEIAAFHDSAAKQLAVQSGQQIYVTKS